MPFHLCSTHVHIASKHDFGSVCRFEISPGGFSGVSGLFVLGGLVDGLSTIIVCDFSLVSTFSDDPPLIVTLQKELAFLLTFVDGNGIHKLLGSLVDIFTSAVGFRDEFN